MSDLGDLKKRALEIRAKYDALNAADGRAPWTAKEYVMGFAGDLGDLIELAMAKAGLRNAKQADVDAELAHELADCLWSLLIIADAYGVNLEAEFFKAMDALEKRIREQKR